MKNVCRKIALLLCALCLLLALTGCDRADYVAAVEVYNAGDYAQARELFLALEDYEDSAELAKRCEYHLAVATYSEGKFEEAIAALEKLGDYEDSLALITHSKYQIALQLKDSRDHDAAEAAFEALEGYANSADHIADIRWARLYDTVLEKGTMAEDGTTCRFAIDGTATTLSVSSKDPYALSFYTEMTKDEGIIITDTLALTVRYGGEEAEYAATSTFSMSWMDAKYGSTQSCSGKTDAASLTGKTVLPVTNYKLQALDVQDTAHMLTDPSGNSMGDGMAANLKVLAADAAGLLQALDSRFTMELIGIPNFV